MIQGAKQFELRKRFGQSQIELMGLVRVCVCERSSGVVLCGILTHQGGGNEVELKFDVLYSLEESLYK